MLLLDEHPGSGTQTFSPLDAHSWLRGFSVDGEGDDGHGVGVVPLVVELEVDVHGHGVVPLLVEDEEMGVVAVVTNFWQHGSRFRIESHTALSVVAFRQNSMEYEDLHFNVQFGWNSQKMFTLGII